MAMSVQPTYFVPRSSYYNSSSREYSVDDSISKAEYFSNAVLEDTYDQAYKSRVRDAELMRNANSTIDGVYYRPIVPTAGLQASLPPVLDQPIPEEQAVATQPENNDGADKKEEDSSSKAVEGSVNIPDYYACGGDPRNQPVSELRRKLRRMVCAGKTTKKYNPHYYKVSE